MLQNFNIGFNFEFNVYLNLNSDFYIYFKFKFIVYLKLKLKNSFPLNIGPAKQPALGRFLLPVAECTFALEQVLEDLQKDPWTCQPDERVQRCTGTALTVALVSIIYLFFLLILFTSCWLF